MRIVESSASVEGTRCAAELRSTYPPTDAFITAHVSQTSLKQNPPKRPSEVLIENGVNNRIQRRVHITQPKGGGEGDARNIVSQSQDVHEEEGQPAGYKTAHD